MTTQRPNLLLILTDEHAPDVAGFAGDPYVRTQHLDDLAARSVQFDTAVCASPVCTPSRMCLLTSKDVHRSAAWQNHWVIFPEHVTWPGHFAAHGYRTCLVGKMHYGGKDQLHGFQIRPYGDFRHGLGHQPDPIDMFPGYANARSAGVSEIPESLMQDVVVVRESLAFAREHADAQPGVPWFLCASFGRPHSPITSPGRYFRRYKGALPPVAVRADERERLEPYARFFYDRYSDTTPEQALLGRAGYYACVDFVDDLIGELLDGLAADGLLDNTIVVYTSDHGEMMGRHGMWGKSVYFEPAAGVPLLMTGPGIAVGHRRVQQPISLMDLFPTTCTLAGLPVPPHLDGVDFSAFLARPAEAAAPRAYAPSSYYKYGGLVNLQHNPIREDKPCEAWRSLRDDRWKYVEVEGGQPLLFDMQNDPGEQANLAGGDAHADICRRMRAALFEGFSWQAAHDQLARDRARLPEFLSGVRPSSPNQYMLRDGRIFDAEKELYDARWLRLPDDQSGGIIPQRFG